nr:AlNc14C24G2413 [Albugo laibachii Nc14]|eukprot:CCA16656.1 AlNc14C24G2413 [Albugo laibachii Nc14]
MSNIDCPTLLFHCGSIANSFYFKFRLKTSQSLLVVKSLRGSDWIKTARKYAIITRQRITAGSKYGIDLH